MGSKREIVVDIICTLFVVLFLYASVSKLLDHDTFRAQVGRSPLLTDIAGFVVWFVPVIELIIAVLLPFSYTRLGALCAALGLMVMFTCYIVAVTQLSDDVPCACGGVFQSMGWTEHLVFNICFVMLAVAAIVLDVRHTSVSPTDGV